MATTQPLFEFLRARPESTVPALELSVSQPAIQQLRTGLGITQIGARGKWCVDRADELRSVGASKFARKHGVTRTLVYDHRRRLLER